MKESLIRQTLRVQLRVIIALTLRETQTTFGESKIGYLWAILMPAVGVGIMVAVFSSFNRRAPFGPSLALFFALGLFTLEYYRKLSDSLMASFQANKALLSYQPIKELDVLIARSILISVTYILIFGVFFTSLIFLDLADLPHHPETLLSAFFVTAFFGFGVGAFNAIISSLWQSWKRIYSVLTKPLFIISGIFYVPSNLPPQAIEILQWNPVLHLIEWMRSGYYENYESTILSKTYPLSLGLFLLVFALIGERLWRQKRI